MRKLTLYTLCCLAALVLTAFLGASAQAEMDGDCLYTLLDEQGGALTMRAGRMYVDDEYISEDNGWYRVVAVDDDAQTAIAQYLGKADANAPETTALVAGANAEGSASGDGKKLIAMYSTHSDESYVPEDGTASKWNGAGIYDVGDSLKEALEEKGIETVYSKESFFPTTQTPTTVPDARQRNCLKRIPTHCWISTGTPYPRMSTRPRWTARTSARCACSWAAPTRTPPRTRPSPGRSRPPRMRCTPGW